MQAAPKITLFLYLFIIAWIVLFKSSLDLGGVLAYGSRSLNLVPFFEVSRGSLSEMLSNVILFAPLGLSFGAILKRIGFWQAFAWVAALSFILEALQFALAIGAADATDVVMNSLGGLIGLMLYRFGRKHVDEKALDTAVSAVVMILVATFLFLRFLVFRVRY